MQFVIDLYNHSVFLYPVTLCAFVAMALTLEHLVYLVFFARLPPGPFMTEIQRLVLANQLDQAVRLCLAAPRAPLANVVKAGLVNADADREIAQLAVEQATLDAVPLLQGRTGYLATIANVVTLFGLLGTIVGLIQSFAAVSNANPEEKENLLSAGIALAMYTTAGGIAVAIPTLVAHAMLVHRANRILDDVDRSALRVLLLLDTRKKAAAAASPATGT